MILAFFIVFAFCTSPRLFSVYFKQLSDDSQTAKSCGLTTV